MDNINEALLDAWLRVSTTVINERVVSEMPYNESLVCNILYRNQRQNPGTNITATDLCNKTKMLKSQMNRTLNSLEKEGIVIRERSKTDKRQVFIQMDMEKAQAYKNQHKKILDLIDNLIEKFGEKKSMEIIEMFNFISDMAEEVI